MLPETCDVACAFGRIPCRRLRGVSCRHKFDFIAASAAKDFEHHRQTYHAMVNYMDGVVGEMVASLKARPGMWENTLWFHQSDNGGPSFSGSSHTANNYPLKGSKMTDWQGGIRVNAFVAGAAASMPSWTKNHVFLAYFTEG